MMKNIIVVSILLTAVSLVSGCGTAKGFGQDVSKVGHTITKVANQ